MVLIVYIAIFNPLDFTMRFIGAMGQGGSELESRSPHSVNLVVIC